MSFRDALVKKFFGRASYAWTCDVGFEREISN